MSSKPDVPAKQLTRCDFSWWSSTSHDKVIRTIPLDGGVTPLSHVGDLRFHGDWIYLSDTSEPAVIVVNQKTGLNAAC